MELKKTMLPMWNDLLVRWHRIQENLPIHKYAHPNKNSSRYGKKVLWLLETAAGRQSEMYYGLKKALMPLPSLVLAFPMFRYLRRFC